VASVVIHDPGGDRDVARRFMSASAARWPAVQLLADDAGGHLFVADGSRLYDIDAVLFARIERAEDDDEIAAILRELGLQGAPFIDDRPLDPPPLYALSLAVAQKCNLGCVYCYAEQGSFGGVPQNMDLATAQAAVDLLLAEAPPGGRVALAFLGGEPLVNRTVLQETTRRAAAAAQRKGVAIGFSITTNGTLLRPADADFFQEFGFAVTVSLDGPREVHDRLRPYQGGHGSFDRIMRNLRPLLTRPRRIGMMARVTVTPDNLTLRQTLDAFIAEGFDSVGFSPLLSAPSGSSELQRGDFETLLGQMIDCGREFERHLAAGCRYPFANLIDALREIHRGTHRPYPCGAGAGYLGVSAAGELAACHRFVGDADAVMGSLVAGIDRGQQADWLRRRHVHRQQPCSGCWARYLCGGGCHHEAIRRGRPACDYIRGWLHYCLGAYLRLSRQCPGWFAEPLPAAVSHAGD
jgi:uncharacterized protein